MKVLIRRKASLRLKYFLIIYYRTYEIFPEMPSINILALEKIRFNIIIRISVARIFYTFGRYK